MIGYNSRNEIAMPGGVRTSPGVTRKELATVLNQHTPTPENQQEEWRPVVGFEGRYEVSDLGCVRSLPPFNRRRSVYLLRPGKSKKGYFTVALGGTGTRTGRTQYVHVLVAVAFLGPVPEGCIVNHKDLDRYNPAAHNLEYITQRENCIHSVVNGAWSGSRLTPDDVRAIRGSSAPVRELANMYGVHVDSIHNVRARRTWAFVSEEVA